MKAQEVKKGKNFIAQKKYNVIVLNINDTLPKLEDHIIYAKRSYKLITEPKQCEWNTNLFEVKGRYEYKCNDYFLDKVFYFEIEKN